MRRRASGPSGAGRAALALALSAAATSLSADESGGTSATYSREVVRIFDRKCVACHRRGDDIPLDTYPDARPWARAIREDVLERRMPPWSAAHGVRPLANDLHLSPREIAAIVSWADGGAPRGDVADLPPREPAPRWAQGTPTLVLSVPPLAPASPGGTRRRRVTLTPRLAGERWLRGFDLAAGERGRVRAAFLFLRASGTAREEWLGGWTPWHAMSRAPEGAAYRLPPGAVLVLEIHGVAPADGEGPGEGVELGLYLEAEPPAAVARTLEVSASRATAGWRRRGESVLVEDTAVWALWPRVDTGGPLEVSAVRADGAREPLLWLTDGPPAWPTPYVLREPIRLPRGSRLVVTAPSGPAGAPASPPSVALAAFANGAGPSGRAVSPAGARPR